MAGGKVAVFINNKMINVGLIKKVKFEQRLEGTGIINMYIPFWMGFHKFSLCLSLA